MPEQRPERPIRASSERGVGKGAQELWCQPGQQQPGQDKVPREECVCGASRRVRKCLQWYATEWRLAMPPQKSQQGER